MTQEMDTQITLTIVRPYIAKSASHDSRNENDKNEMKVDPRRDGPRPGGVSKPYSYRVSCTSSYGRSLIE